MIEASQDRTPAPPAPADRWGGSWDWLSKCFVVVAPRDEAAPWYVFGPYGDYAAITAATSAAAGACGAAYVTTIYGFNARRLAATGKPRYAYLARMLDTLCEFDERSEAS